MYGGGREVIILVHQSAYLGVHVGVSWGTLFFLKSSFPGMRIPFKGLYVLIGTARDT